MIALHYITKHCRTEGVGQRLKATIKKPASTSKRLCVYGKIRTKMRQRKSPRIKEMGTTLTLGQFVGARMGGLPPQYLVS
jgi:hypothetical protein